LVLTETKLRLGVDVYCHRRREAQNGGRVKKNAETKATKRQTVRASFFAAFVSAG
jgi:hypothetical protein